MLFLVLLTILLFIILFYSKMKCRLRERFKFNKLAFLFLIYDEINNEEVWKTFFKNVPVNSYDIFIHYKTYKKSDYFDKYKLKDKIYL
jgi:hypothetical protein